MPASTATPERFEDRRPLDAAPQDGVEHDDCTPRVFAKGDVDRGFGQRRDGYTVDLDGGRSPAGAADALDAPLDLAPVPGRVGHRDTLAERPDPRQSEHGDR
ncbi:MULTISPECIES: hypothetical protein [unclassified Curtobacterium]|uniref:hypothetical protein n=1 Tax=unclassified Curtobacterium TaxID=257496 RepID=UPI001044BDF1|nr:MULTISPECIES: hypothetical protein [unclassified Curtobacterium]